MAGYWGQRPETRTDDEADAGQGDAGPDTFRPTVTIPPPPSDPTKGRLGTIRMAAPLDPALGPLRRSLLPIRNSLAPIRNTLAPIRASLSNMVRATLAPLAPWVPRWKPWSP